MQALQAIQVFDGTMLSDANIYPSRGSGETSRYLDSFFRMQLGRNKHIDWLTHIKVHLEELGITFSSMYPKLHKRRIDDYVTSWLVSHVSPYITEQRKRWYKEGKKIVPRDVHLTPVVVANWFMGDGTSSYNGTKAVEVCFGTYAFSPLDVSMLRNKLREMKIFTGLAKSSKGSVITVPQDSVDDLMTIIKPHVVPSFQYKIKYRR